MKPVFFLSIFVLFFSFTAVRAQAAENELTFADKRQIIGVLLNEKFSGSPEKTIYVSTANLPDEIQKDFPPVKNKKIQLVSTEPTADTEVCAYEFGKFEFIDKFVSVTFGDCREGLAYDFKKFGDRWKSVGLTITKPLFY